MLPHLLASSRNRPNSKTVNDLDSSLSDFSLVDKEKDLARDGLQSKSESPYDWKPTRWTPYPFPKDYQIEEKPWLRPAQLPMSFVGVKVIDAKNSKIISNQTVKIRGGLIEKIAKSEDKDMQESGWNSIDARGLYMCPGLIDCHVHIRADMDNGSSPVGQNFGQAYATAFNLKTMLWNGFTTVRDVGGANRHDRQATEEWLMPGPRLFVGGPVLSQSGGHGDHRPVDDPMTRMGPEDGGMGAGLSMIVDGVDSCLKAARHLMMGGADHIKICSSGGVLSTVDKLESEQLTIPEIKVICDTVRMMGGTLVTSHCFTSQGARNAIEGGIGGIEHGSLIDEPTLKLMAQKGVHYTPTFIVQDIIVNGPMGKLIAPVSLAKAKRVEKATYETVKTAHKVGVNIGFGTDCPFDVQLCEFELRARILPSPAILKQATYNGAKIVGREGMLGEIRQGAYADFLLLSENPMEDVRILNKPNEYLKAVVKDGRCVRSNVDGLRVEITID